MFEHIQQLGSLETRLQTKRAMIGNVAVCRGCCCGETPRGKPEVPVDLLKREWRQRGLLKTVHLSISGCLGPCDLANVVSISSAAGTVWLGALHELRNYTTLLEWAQASKNAEYPLPVPSELSVFRFNPFQATSFNSTQLYRREKGDEFARCRFRRTRWNA